MTTISALSFPNLYEVSSRNIGPQLSSGPSLGEKVSVDLRDLAPSRTLPEDAVQHQPIVRYTNAQMEMRPVDRADAALMAIAEPETFAGFIEAVKNDGDWRSILEGFTQKIPAHPEWLEDSFRLPAAEILRRSNYFMDLSALSSWLR